MAGVALDIHGVYHGAMATSEGRKRQVAGGRRSRRPAFRPTEPQAALVRAGQYVEAQAAGVPLRYMAQVAGVSHETIRRHITRYK